MRKKKTYKRKKYGSGIKVTRPYINKKNCLMLGEGKNKKTKGWIFCTNCSSVSRTSNRNSK